MVDPANCAVIAEHELGAPGAVVLDDTHYGGARKPVIRAPLPKTAAEKQFCPIGEIAEQFLRGAAAIGNTSLASELDELIALHTAQGHDQFTAALTRAVAFRRFKAAGVRSILATGACALNPRTAVYALVTPLPTTPSATSDGTRSQTTAR